MASVKSWIRKSFKRSRGTSRGASSETPLVETASANFPPPPQVGGHRSTVGRGDQVDGSVSDSMIRGGSKTLHRTDVEMLHYPRNMQHLRDMLERPECDPNRRDENGDAPIHAFVKSTHPDKVDLVIALLTHSKADINLKAADNFTALHFAVMMGDVMCTKALIAFGADILAEGENSVSVLDVATSEWVSTQKNEKVAATPLLPTTTGIGLPPPMAMSDLRLIDVQPEQSTEEKPPAEVTQKEAFHVRTTPRHTARPRSITGNKSRLPFKIRNPWGSSRKQHHSREDDLCTSFVYQDKSPTSSQPVPRDLPSPTKRHLSTSQGSSEDTRDFDHSMWIKTKSPTRADKEEEVKSKPTVKKLPTMATPQQRDKILQLLYSVGAQHGGSKRSEQFKKLPQFIAFENSSRSEEFARSFKIKDFVEGKTPLSLYEQLTEHINSMLEQSEAPGDGNPDEDYALRIQQRELREFEKTKKDDGIFFSIQGGSRILVLDGGGMKGLVEIEVLAQLEEYTGRRITELFDWIIGTSTGGIVALGLVYADKSLKELRQLYFKLKDVVFSQPGRGMGFDSKALESLLIESFGGSYRMSDVPHPKVLIPAVNKNKSPPQLHFFNNCFGDKFSTQLVWKVARYTSAAPMFFTSFENYVDGGVLANNPCDYGLTAIQNYFIAQKKKLPIAMMVSLGSGIYPAEDLGDINAQELLYFGPQLLQMNTIMKRAKNLISLLTTALVESEIVAENCSARCREQGIPFFRFSPHLDETIAAGEVDNEKLITMIVRAKQQTWDQGMPDLLQLFRQVAEENKKRKFLEQQRSRQS